MQNIIVLLGAEFYLHHLLNLACSLLSCCYIDFLHNIYHHFICYKALPCSIYITVFYCRNVFWQYVVNMKQYIAIRIEINDAYFIFTLGSSIFFLSALTFND